MSDRPAPNYVPWPEVLSQASHELRTPLSVAAGYLRMILGERSGPLTEQQRQFMTEVEKATRKIHALTEELSELAKFDAEDPKERTAFTRTPVAIGALVNEAIASLPPLPDDRQIALELQDNAPDARVDGDPQRLLKAVSSVLYMTRRELVGSERLIVRLRRVGLDAGSVLRVDIAGDHRIDAVQSLPEQELARFNEKRGGCGLAPSIARRILSEHDGHIWSTTRSAEPGDGDERQLLKRQRNAEVVLVLPERR
jgi:signal transduction histidine kinase